MNQVRDNECCGCTACLSICPRHAINMKENKKGFLEPSIDVSKCVRCGLCDQVCPLHIPLFAAKEQKFMAAKLKNSKKRLKSQSGGAFVALSEEILQGGGVVYGVKQDPNFEAVYSRADSYCELKHLLGSKYIQARVENTFELCKNDLLEGKTVLFSGTPCHIHGLKMFLAKAKTDMTNLITIDLICHGVPSPKVYREYLALLERRHKKKITAFNFRCKQFGWHGHAVVIKLGSKSYRNDDYVRAFYSHYFLRNCCYSCHYSNLNRVGDITIGDCWGIEKTHSDFDDNKGVSLLILNSEKGSFLWEKIADKFDSLIMTQKEILQPNLESPTVAPDDMPGFWLDYGKYGCEYVLYHYCGCDPMLEREMIYKHQYLRRIILKLLRIYHRLFET